MDETSITAKMAAALATFASVLVAVTWGNLQWRLNKHDTHIEKLYENAETDRKLVRDLHDDAMAEIRGLHRDTLAAILKVKE